MVVWSSTGVEFRRQNLLGLLGPSPGAQQQGLWRSRNGCERPVFPGYTPLNSGTDQWLVFTGLTEPAGRNRSRHDHVG